MLKVIPKYGEIACNLFLAGQSIILGIKEYAEDNGDSIPTDSQIEAAMIYVHKQFKGG
jgi:hypothetical protein